MEKYIFILGNNHEISLAEIKAVLPNLKLLEHEKEVAIFLADSLDCQKAQKALGGTIKIAKVIGETLTEKLIVGEILASSVSSGKVKFGFSWHAMAPDKKFGLKIKKQLKQKNISCRYVESREPQLSSVIVAKEKCLDFIVLPSLVALTCSVQDFKDYSQRDFGRPKADSYSGMLPPKLAKMMVNLAAAEKKEILLDPFCGSGTVLAEALMLDWEKVIGSDLSKKAVSDSQDNLKWLEEKFQLAKNKWQVFEESATSLGKILKKNSVSAIATEPYLGPPLRGGETAGAIIKIKTELSQLYLEAFKQFKEVLVNCGKVVMVFPEWHIAGNVFKMEIDQSIIKLNFVRLDEGNLIYKRENQKVWRQITIWHLKK